MSIYLVRHAKAGDRNAWTGPDDLRPLSKAGRRQADALADRFEDRAVLKVVSSPSVRCRQTVQPLGERTRLPVELDERLAEGTPPSKTMDLLDDVLANETVLCTHGDVMGHVLTQLDLAGVPLFGDRAEKGSVWILEVVDGTITAARHEPAPAVPGK